MASEVVNLFSFSYWEGRCSCTFLWFSFHSEDIHIVALHIFIDHLEIIFWKSSFESHLVLLLLKTLSCLLLTNLWDFFILGGGGESLNLLFDITIVNAFSRKCLPFISLLKKISLRNSILKFDDAIIISLFWCVWCFLPYDFRKLNTAKPWRYFLSFQLWCPRL